MSKDSPERKCKLGTCCLDIKNNKKLKSQDEADCDWWINSPEHSNCFWTFVRDKSGPDGSMNELVQSEIADLMGWSNTKTHFMLKTAVQELVEALKTHKAQELLGEAHESVIDFLNLTSGTSSREDSND